VTNPHHAARTAVIIRRMRVLRHVLAIVLLPGMATLLVPALLVSGDEVAAWPPALLGAALIALGLVLMAQTIALFATAGDGTLAPWDPTSRLVVRGPYRRVRNPMISGVLCVLLGEALLFGSTALLAWAALFLAINAIWFPLVEEPGLRQRFGADYDVYRAAVPRWLPRLRPWINDNGPPERAVTTSGGSGA
jgi:protein-S-isoprenylcysteine O-methyltransferase Ste14